MPTPATDRAASTAPPVSTSAQASAGATVASLPPCDSPVDFLSTASGRRILLRARDLTGPSPTIIVIHGYTGTPTGIEKYAELTDDANELGIAVAYPEGSPTANGGFGWNTGAAVMATEVTDDVMALAEMVDAIVMSGCVDPGRIILTGESNGAAMALVAACAPRLATRFTRVVLVNAAVDDAVLGRCSQPRHAAPLTVVAGAEDLTTPIEGNGDLLPVDDWFAAAAASISGCRTVETAPPIDAVVSRVVATGCSVCNELLVVSDGTHTWPGTTRGVSGLVPGTFALNSLLVGAALNDTAGCLTEL